MDHSQIQNRLEAFFDKELPAFEMKEIGAHVEVCLLCRELVGELERMHAVLAQPSGEKLSGAFTFRVMEAIERKEKFELSTFLKWLIPSLALPAAALFLIAALPLSVEESFSIQNILKKDNPFSAAEAMTLQSGSDWTGLETL